MQIPFVRAVLPLLAAVTLAVPCQVAHAQSGATPASEQAPGIPNGTVTVGAPHAPAGSVLGAR